MTLHEVAFMLADSIREKTGSDDVRVFESVVTDRRYIGAIVDDVEYTIQIDVV